MVMSPQYFRSDVVQDVDSSDSHCCLFILMQILCVVSQTKAFASGGRSPQTPSLRLCPPSNPVRLTPLMTSWVGMAKLKICFTRRMEGATSGDSSIRSNDGVYEAKLRTSDVSHYSYQFNFITMERHCLSVDQYCGFYHRTLCQCGICCRRRVCVCVCVSVCLSQAVIVSQRLQIWYTGCSQLVPSYGQ